MITTMDPHARRPSYQHPPQVLPPHSATHPHPPPPPGHHNAAAVPAFPPGIDHRSASHQHHPLSSAPQQHLHYQHLHSHPQHQQPAPPPPHPPPPPTQQPPSAPPAPSHHHPQQSGPPPPPHQQVQQQQHPHYAAPPPPKTGPSLPPILSPSEQSNLPPLRHQSAQPHDPREGAQEYSQQYNNHVRSGHATPSLGGRSYSQHERTPTTPSGPPPYPPPSPDGAQPSQPPMMNHGDHHNMYAPPNPPPHVIQPPPPPPHTTHHDSHGAPYITPMVDHHAQYPPGPMYAGHAYAPSSSALPNQKRRHLRAQQACDQCRGRKQKCDEGQPCSFCKDNNLSCVYRDPPLVKTDKNMEKLLTYMESHAQGLEELKAQFSGFEARLRVIEENRNQQYQNSAPGVQAKPIDFQLNEMDVDEKPDRAAILGDHRTAPHKLLLIWPTVKPLLSESGIDFNDGYVMEAEDRGMLRLYTAGEAADEPDGTQGGMLSEAMKSEPSPEEQNAPTPTQDGVWSSAAYCGPPDDRRMDFSASPGGRRPTGGLDLDVNTIHLLCESYLENIHVMHPILNERRLRRMVDAFSRRYGTSQSRGAYATPGATNDLDQRPMKRQRSNGSTAISVIPTAEADLRREPVEAIEHSPGNAVVLLVLALGKICLHKAPLPGFVPDSKLQTNTVIAHSAGVRGTGDVNTSFSMSSPGSAIMRSAHMSPQSPLATPHNQPVSPVDHGYRHDARHSAPMTNGAASSRFGKNIDVIPGLSYYAKATEIIGEQADGNDLIHAQIFLLAGLFKGQLARVKESMSWIQMAGRALLSLLDRYKLYNHRYWKENGADSKVPDPNPQATAQARIKDSRHILIVIAAWTCLQLETDILAEMKFPPSGIQEKEPLLLFPIKDPQHEHEIETLQGTGGWDSHDSILMYYISQLFLRRRLNLAHAEIYGPDMYGKPLSHVQEMLVGQQDILETWRATLPVDMRWDDNDKPASRILDARLRGKYYGAKYVFNRPFLDYALHIMPHVRDNLSIEDVAKDAYGSPRDKADIHIFKAIQQMGDSAIWQAAKRCIDAAMLSTVAFDGLDGRPIVTNIHGTSHAQFGNMLVLSATYSSPYLKQLVPEDKFKALLKRTIKFLRRLAPISPTSRADCLILEKFETTLFPPADTDPATFRDEGVVRPALTQAGSPTS